MDNIKFEFQGRVFNIVGLDYLECEGVTVSGITPCMTLSQIRSICEHYINFLNEGDE